MKDLEDLIKDITDAEKIAKKDVKFIYDFSLSLILNESDKTFLNLSNSDAKQLLDWLNDDVLPIYEEASDFEKCQRIKTLVDRIKYLRKI